MAFDLQRQIAYWREGALEELDAAQVLVDGEKLRHALFWTHLALEKALKAHVAKQSKTVPPYTHSLPRLAELAKIDLTPSDKMFLAAIDGQQIIGRYGNMGAEDFIELTKENVAERLAQAERIVKWLIQQL